MLQKLNDSLDVYAATPFTTNICISTTKIFIFTTDKLNLKTLYNQHFICTTNVFICTTNIFICTTNIFICTTNKLNLNNQPLDLYNQLLLFWFPKYSSSYKTRYFSLKELCQPKTGSHRQLSINCWYFIPHSM